VSKDVEFGHEFTVGDFREAQVSFSVQGTQLVLFSQLSELVGAHYRSTVPIRRGTLLTTSMISTKLEVPGVDYASLGVNVPEGQYPAGIGAGDKVKVLYTPTSDKGVAAGGIKTGTPLQLGRTLVDVAYVSSVASAVAGQGGLVVSLVVRNEDLTVTTQAGMPIVAAANALSAITLVVLPESTDAKTGSDR
jgi:hypothetical protein